MTIPRFISRIEQTIPRRKILASVAGILLSLPVSLLFLAGSPAPTLAQSTNPWNLYNNPTYGNALDMSLGPSTVDPPPLRLHSNGNMMVRGNIILGPSNSGAINSQTWGSTAKSLLFNSATVPWWIRQNASDTQLAFGVSTDVADTSIRFLIDNTGKAQLPRAGARLDFAEISANTTAYTGIGTLNGNMSDGTPYYGAFGREPGAWVSPFPDYLVGNHTGLRLHAHGGYGGVSIYEQLNPAGNAWSSSGNEVARFRDDRYGGTYVNGRLGVGGITTPATRLDVNGALLLRTGGADAGGASSAGARIMSTPNLHIDSQDGSNSIYFNYWGGTGSALFCDGGGGGVCNTSISYDGILTVGGNYGRTTTTHAAGYYEVNYPYQMFLYNGSEFFRSYMDGNWNMVFRTTNSPVAGNMIFYPKGNVAVGFGNGDQLITYQPYDDALALQTTLNGQPNNGYGGDPPNRLMLQPVTGFVSIGHTNPQGKMDILAGGDDTVPAIRMRQSNAASYGYDMGIDNNYDGGLYFHRVNNGAQALTMDLRRDNGWVGIKTYPGSDLHIKQSSNGQGSGGIRLERADTGGFAQILEGSDQQLYLFTNSNNQYCVVTIYNSITCPSDKRLKENINPLEGSALDIISQLKPSTFTLKNNGQQSAGFIAQEVMDVLPQAVNLSEMTGFYSLSDAYFTPYIVKGIQELNTKTTRIQNEADNTSATIKSLSEQVKSQQAEIENLKKMIEDLKK